MVPRCVQWLHHRIVVAGNPGPNPLVARNAGDPHITIGDGDPAPYQNGWLPLQTPVRVCRCRQNSGETASHVKRFPFLQYVVTGPR